MTERTDTERIRWSTFVVGSDGRTFNLAVTRFPKTTTYLPANAYTAPWPEDTPDAA